MTVHGDDVTDLSTHQTISGGTTTGSIVAGTGKYAGLVGDWSQSENAYRALLSAVGNNSMGWYVHLHKGATKVAIAYPYTGSTITQAIDPGLRIVSAPRVLCTATATSGAMTINVGSKKTTRRAARSLLRS